MVHRPSPMLTGLMPCDDNIAPPAVTTTAHLWEETTLKETFSASTGLPSACDILSVMVHRRGTSPILIASLLTTCSPLTAIVDAPRHTPSVRVPVTHSAPTLT